MDERKIMDEKNEKQSNQLTPADQALRTRIRTHCEWMYQFEPTYAEAAYQRYREQLPWLRMPKTWRQ